MNRLKFELRLAYSAEMGSSTAYARYAELVDHPEIASDIRIIEARAERHRTRVRSHMNRMGTRSSQIAERWFGLVGKTMGVGGRFWGAWLSCIGASVLERLGVADYRRGAAAAERAGYLDIATELEGFGLEERAHNLYFRRLAGWYFRRKAGPPPRLTEAARAVGLVDA